MRSTVLATAIVLAFSAGVSAAPAVDPMSLSSKAAAGAETRSTYIVRFAEPPLAAFRGAVDGFPKLAGLKATSPAATGARKLDMKSAESKAYLGALAGLRESRLAGAAAAFGRPLQPLFVYDVALNGVALELSAKEAAALARFDGIEAVEKERVFETQTDAGPRWIHADAVWTAPAPQGNRGEGVVVGVIDTGINRTHPAFAATGPVDGHAHANPAGNFFGACVGNASLCNSKLIGIHDFTICTGVHANPNGECDDREANDGSDPDGHGSHVASTAAGNTLNISLTFPGLAPVARQISGVAPHANVISYKACEEEEDCRGSWLVAAVNQAAADGVDALNYSIGGEPYPPWQDSIALAMLSAREAGVTVVAAAGNDGPEPGTLNSSGNAPWVLSIANASHDRAIVNRVVGLSGGATSPPGGGTLVGQGATAGVGPVPIVYAGDFGSPLCATGNNVDAMPPNTTTNPWSTNVFNGQIVVCDRGIYARVIKGFNVENAGGAGMILVNSEADGESVVPDEHELPASHLGYVDGLALKQWLSTGTGHTGRIEGAAVQNLARYADILSASSGRGPVTPFGAIKPNVTAPGSGIIAAAGTGNGIANLSGTSMATPHVTGAAALLIGANPSWGPSEVETALMTTARPSVVLPDGVTPATVFDQGAGVVDLARAMDSGLSFPVNRAAFLAAEQADERLPNSLNLPSLGDSACFSTCTFTREIKALIAGTWRATSAVPGTSVVVSPSEFTLAANATQSVSIAISPSAQSLNQPLEGSVTFTRVGGGATPARLPVAITPVPGSAPAIVQVSTTGESGFHDIPISDLVALPDARFAGTNLVAPTRKTLSLRQDTTSLDPFNGFLPINAGTHWILLTVENDGPAGVIADVTSATADDIDLYVGFDTNGDGFPQESELVCLSGSPTATERCSATVPHAEAGDRFWVLPQNWRSPTATTPETTDDVAVSAAAISLVAVNDEFVATGPGHSETNQDFAIRAAWDVPDLLPGDKRFGYVIVAAEPGQPTGAAKILFELTRATPGAHAPQVLVPGATRNMALAAGQAQDRLYLDVPPNATGLTVTTAGTGEVDLYVAHADAATGPAIAAAPARGTAAGTSIHPGAAETLTLNDAALTPGRWYITPVNSGTTSAQFTLKADLAFGAPRPNPKFGPYFNPARSGSGVFLFPAGDAWGLAWYTYLQDGSPTWYLGVLEAPGANQGVWTVQLQRQTWNGSVSTGTDVGEGQLAFTDDEHFSFSWNLDGQSGSEPMTWIDGGDCPQLGGVPAALSGLWFSPTQQGYGYSISAYAGLESNGAYFYDDLGLPRWSIGSRSPFDGGEQTLVLSQQNGPCPLCTYAAPTSTEIGTLTRTFTDADSGQIAVDVELAAPISGSWTVDLPVVRASNALSCQ